MAARFFCDNCGTEVKRATNRCPRCGRYFAFVRCPQCDFTGEESLFAKGCPRCGYCAAGQGKVPAWPAVKPRLVPAGKLPPWVYILAGLGLVLVIVVLFLMGQ
ncbi:hypothetical protein AGMMS50230_09050 [Spirochaetia bacterium]|nr:hypothetical protein AGMMS50230_09050 [Spirochaetia bacterium]